ncbi:ABC transporter permease [Terrilactibacillus laevilacticus]|uniref:ABC transporter permease n=1 Tax=Terrilactibacillus laevilacticus TaxID=1380157 RepID=A0ABW5PQM6_9BACI|nr:ABC transporter permease [Terrilactibacillus laevilacticus]
MDSLISLWQRRLRDYWIMASRYWGIIGKNSGLMFTLYVLIILGSVYYKKTLDQLPETFPVSLVLTVVFGFFVIRTPIRTFIQQADVIFLLPLESQMGRYFYKSCRYSFMLQCAIIIIVFVLFSPLYLKYPMHSVASYLLVLILAFFVKAWNMDCKWHEQYSDNPFLLKVIRGCLTLLFLYAVISQQPIVLAITYIIVMGLVSYFLFHRQRVNGVLHWDRLIAMENHQMMLLLRFTNLFVDVPQLKGRVKSRPWLNVFLKFRKFDKVHVFRYLYFSIFLRAEDYLGIYLRLTIVGAILSFYTDHDLFALFVILSVLYLTGLQLYGIFTRPVPQALAGMYPITKAVKIKSYCSIILICLFVQGLLLSIITTISHPRISFALLSMLITLVVSIGLSYGYYYRKLIK